jgi:hypothetical protein
MTTVYLDESGYTGEDLIAADQPVFVICTYSIDEASRNVERRSRRTFLTRRSGRAMVAERA